MKRDQRRTPMLEGIENYRRAPTMPFAVPAHKTGRGAAPIQEEVVGRDVFEADIAIEGGIDDLRGSHGYQSEAQTLAAEAWGAEEAYFSTNGSSLSIQTCILSLGSPGDELIAVRNAHKSAVAGMILSGHRPIFPPGSFDDELEIEHPPTPQAIEQTLKKHPKATAVVIVSPSYYGVAGDVEGIARVCHERDVPLIVDEAWGAHLPFHDELPTHAMAAGADLAVASMHKSIAGLMESSIVMYQGKLIDRPRLSMTFELLESTSISSLITSLMDGARRQMALEGRALLDEALKLARQARQRLRDEGFDVIGTEVVGRTGAVAYDETKLVIDVRGLGITGYEAWDWLAEQKHVTFELADHRRLLGVVTIGDDQESIDRLVDALKSLRDWTRRDYPNRTMHIPRLSAMRSALVTTPRNAYFAEFDEIPLAQAAGRVSAEMISPYPPGIPAIIPGQRFNQAIIDYLKAGMEHGMSIPDSSDPSLQNVRVVRKAERRRGG
jgi:arginine/lysine/ornithine decarboxylase